MSERVFENGSTSSTSRLITALNLALSSENIAPAIPEGQFGFSAVIETDKTILDSKEFDFEFDICLLYTSDAADE